MGGTNATAFIEAIETAFNSRSSTEQEKIITALQLLGQQDAGTTAGRTERIAAALSDAEYIKQLEHCAAHGLYCFEYHRRHRSG